MRGVVWGILIGLTIWALTAALAVAAWMATR